MIDATELAMPRTTGNHGSNPGRSGKYFALTHLGARAFLSTAMNAASVITSTTLPPAIVNQGVRFDDPGPHGAGPSVFFSELQLFSVHGTTTLPSIVSEEL